MFCKILYINLVQNQTYFQKFYYYQSQLELYQIQLIYICSHLMLLFFIVYYFISIYYIKSKKVDQITITIFSIFFVIYYEFLFLNLIQICGTFVFQNSNNTQTNVKFKDIQQTWEFFGILGLILNFLIIYYMYKNICVDLQYFKTNFFCKAKKTFVFDFIQKMVYFFSFYFIDDTNYVGFILLTIIVYVIVKTILEIKYKYHLITNFKLTIDLLECFYISLKIYFIVTTFNINSDIEVSTLMNLLISWQVYFWFLYIVKKQKLRQTNLKLDNILYRGNNIYDILEILRILRNVVQIQDREIKNRINFQIEQFLIKKKVIKKISILDNNNVVFESCDQFKELFNNNIQKFLIEIQKIAVSSDDINIQLINLILCVSKDTFLSIKLFVKMTIIEKNINSFSIEQNLLLEYFKQKIQTFLNKKQKKSKSGNITKQIQKFVKYNKTQIRLYDTLESLLRTGICFWQGLIFNYNFQKLQGNFQEMQKKLKKFEKFFHYFIKRENTQLTKVQILEKVYTQMFFCPLKQKKILEIINFCKRKDKKHIIEFGFVEEMIQKNSQDKLIMIFSLKQNSFGLLQSISPQLNEILQRQKSFHKSEYIQQLLPYFIKTNFQKYFDVKEGEYTNNLAQNIDFQEQKKFLLQNIKGYLETFLFTQQLYLDFDNEQIYLLLFLKHLKFSTKKKQGFFVFDNNNQIVGFSQSLQAIWNLPINYTQSKQQNNLNLNINNICPQIMNNLNKDKNQTCMIEINYQRILEQGKQNFINLQGIENNNQEDKKYAFCKTKVEDLELNKDYKICYLEVNEYISKDIKKIKRNRNSSKYSIVSQSVQSSYCNEILLQNHNFKLLNKWQIFFQKFTRIFLFIILPVTGSVCLYLIFNALKVQRNDYEMFQKILTFKQQFSLDFLEVQKNYSSIAKRQNWYELQNIEKLKDAIISKNKYFQQEKEFLNNIDKYQEVKEKILQAKAQSKIFLKQDQYFLGDKVEHILFLQFILQEIQRQTEKKQIYDVKISNDLQNFILDNYQQQKNISHQQTQLYMNIHKHHHNQMYKYIDVYLSVFFILCLVFCFCLDVFMLCLNNWLSKILLILVYLTYEEINFMINIIRQIQKFSKNERQNNSPKEITTQQNLKYQLRNTSTNYVQNDSLLKLENYLDVFKEEQQRETKNNFNNIQTTQKLKGLKKQRTFQQAINFTFLLFFQILALGILFSFSRNLIYDANYQQKLHHVKVTCNFQSTLLQINFELTNYEQSTILNLAEQNYNYKFLDLLQNNIQENLNHFQLASQEYQEFLTNTNTNMCKETKKRKIDLQIICNNQDDIIVLKSILYSVIENGILMLKQKYLKQKDIKHIKKQFQDLYNILQYQKQLFIQQSNKSIKNKNKYILKQLLVCIVVVLIEIIIVFLIFIYQQDRARQITQVLGLVIQNKVVQNNEQIKQKFQTKNKNSEVLQSVNLDLIK